MEQSGEEGAFWICAFAVYQSGDDNDGPTITQQLGTDPEYGPFAMVLRGATSMVAVITETCDIYTRLWYVYFNQLIVVFNIIPFAMNDPSNILLSLYRCCYYETSISQVRV